MVLHDAEEAAELAALRAAMLGRWQPLDAAEAHWVEELVFVAWRQRRLRVVEDAVLARAGEPEAGLALPSLATVIRYRGRLDRDWRRAVEELAALRRGRKGMVDPAQLRWLADRLDHAGAAAAAPLSPSMSASDGVTTRGTSEPRHAPPPLPEPGTNDLAPAGTREPGIANDTNEIETGTNEPTRPNRTNEFAAGTNEPRHPVPPLPASYADEPAGRPLNRHQRRRLAALTRRAA
jgi:hypothetical protein